MKGYSVSKKTIVDENGKIDLSSYDYVDAFHNGYAIVKKNMLYGIIDIKGNLVVPLKYDEINKFNNGLAKVKLNEKYGFIDKNGNEVISLKYMLASDFYDDKAVVSKDGKNDILIDKNGMELTDFKDTKIQNFNGNDIAVIRTNSKFGLIDKQGKVILSPQKHTIKPVKNNLAVMIKGHGPTYKFDVIDKDGKVHKLSSYYDVNAIGNNILCVSSDNLFWLINCDNQEITKRKYNSIIPFYNNLFCVEINKKWGLIDSCGHVILEPYYDCILPELKGSARVKKDGHWGLINQDGQEITEIKYNMLTGPYNGLMHFKLDGKKGCLNLDGKEQNYSDIIISKYYLNKKYILCECCKDYPKYILLDKDENFLTELPFSSIKVSSNMIIFDNTYMFSVEDLKFIYQCIIENKGRKIVKNFDKASNRDLYYKVAKKELDCAEKRYQKAMNDLSIKLENVYYSDIDKNIDYSYEIKRRK